MLGEAEAGLGIDDVGVAFPSDHDVLMEVAGGGNGAVFERKRSSGAKAESAEGDLPSVFFWRWVAESEIASGCHERLRQACGGEVIENGIGGISFGNSAEVESHAGSGEGRGLLIRVEDERLVSAGGARFFEQWGSGEALRHPGLAPEPGGSSESGVVGSFGDFCDLQRLLEEIEKSVADENRGVDRGVAKLIELGIGFVVGRDLANFLGFIEGFTDCSQRFWPIRAVGNDPKKGTHEGPLELNSSWNGSRRRLSAGRKKKNKEF